MVLTPTDLKYYVTSHQKHIKGVIVFEKSHTVEVSECHSLSATAFVLFDFVLLPLVEGGVGLNTGNFW